MNKVKDHLLQGILWISAILTIVILVTIIGFIFLKGYKLMNISLFSVITPQLVAEEFGQ
jgi:phosphate transport system permease protein